MEDDQDGVGGGDVEKLVEVAQRGPMRLDLRLGVGAFHAAIVACCEGSDADGAGGRDAMAVWIVSHGNGSGAGSASERERVHRQPRSPRGEEKPRR